MSHRRSWGHRAVNDPWWEPVRMHRRMKEWTTGVYKTILGFQTTQICFFYSILTSATSSRIVFMHSTTLSILPPTSTTRSVEWGQHSWKSLMLVFVFWKHNRLRDVRERVKHMPHINITPSELTSRSSLILAPFTPIIEPARLWWISRRSSQSKSIPLYCWYWGSPNTINSVFWKTLIFLQTLIK